MNYSDYTTTLGDLLQIPIITPSSATPSSNTDFNNILPNIINDAEQRIYRECDFLATRTVDVTTTFTANNRSLTLPTQIIVVQSVAAISPAATIPASGVRNRLELVSIDTLNALWPQETGTGATGIPRYGAMQSNTVLVVAPTPDAAYKAEFTGIFRPAAISASNTTTYLSLNFPDLFLAASMVFATGYQRDFGAQSDDPKMAQSWEALYQTRKQSVVEEEQRRKGQSTGWSPMSAAPLSSPQRS